MYIYIYHSSSSWSSPGERVMMAERRRRKCGHQYRGMMMQQLLGALVLGSLAASTAPAALVNAATDASGGGGGVAIIGGTLVNDDGASFLADVFIRGGTVTKIIARGDDGKQKGAAVEEEDLKTYEKVVDATGKLVMPGGIDPHTHMEMPFMGQQACDDFESGQRAALAGGTTFHIDFALPVDGDMRAGLAMYEEKAAKSVMDYGFHMAVTRWDDQARADMGWLAAEKGINSFKFFMAYKGALMVTDEQLVQGMRRAREVGALVQVHAENGDAVALGQAEVIAKGITGPEGHYMSRPAVLEDEATARAIRLARFVNVPLYVVHVMSKGAAEEISRARDLGQRVIGEAVASGIACDESQVRHPNFKIAAQYVMSPPIRKKDVDGAALKSMLVAGSISIVGTDHAVFNSEQKAKGKNDFRIIPNGVNGIEERLHIVWDEMVNSGLATPAQFVRMVSTDVAKAFNIYPQKGRVCVGCDADVIVFDPEAWHTISASTHHSNMDTNIYEGRKVKGRVTSTISRGRLVYHNGTLDVERGSGRRVIFKPFGPLFEGLDLIDERRSQPAVKRLDLGADASTEL